MGWANVSPISLWEGAMSSNAESQNDKPAPEVQRATSDKKHENTDQDSQLLRVLANRFLLQLDALVETANRIMIITMRSYERARQEYATFVEPRFKGNDTGKLTLRSSTPEFQEFQKLNKAVGKASAALVLVPRSFLVSMVTQYDTFLSGTVRQLFKLKPEKIRSAESSMKIRDIVKFTSIDDLVQQVIDDEIDESMRGNHIAQLEWITKRFDFSTDFKDPLVQRFAELTERRNAYVHTDGCINRQYLNVCSSFPDDIVKDRRLGKRMPVNRAYLEAARDTLFEVGIRVMQAAWRKQREDQRELQDSSLNEVIFDLLQREDYRLARNIADFSGSLRNLASDRNKRLLTINQAQAYKWSGKEEQAKKIVDQMDWSSTSANLKMAVALIRDGIAAAARIMSGVPSDVEGDDAVTAEAYRTWPLFKKARNEPAFLDAFEAKFGEPLVTETITVPADAIQDTPIEATSIEPNPETNSEAGEQANGLTKLEPIN
ncbi:MAG TPA: hypothetical protein VN734_03005 [Acidobacteriaceae bacterium]|nr:hypothetical protein [Acidobacteriaceae bacterium]